MEFQGMSFGINQKEGAREIESQPGLTMAEHSQQPQEASQALSSRPGLYEMSMIDPALIGSLGSPIGMYNDSIYSSRQGQPEPQYAQSYERYHSATPSTPTSAHVPTVSNLRQSLAAQDATLSTEPRFRNFSNILPSKGIALPNTESPTSAQPFVGHIRDNRDGHQPNMVEFDRPVKRVRYSASQDTNNIPHDATMPPPDITSYPHSVDSQASSSILRASSSANTPMTPASSNDDDNFKDTYKPYPAKLSPLAHSSPGLRRLSVNSLLSGPVGISYQSDRTEDGESQEIQDWSQYQRVEFDDATIYGIDRGFKDLDIGKNDDMNAITGSSPRTMREHLDFIVDEDNELMEFGFGMKENPAFETGAYYDKPVHVSIPRVLEPLPSKLLENPMNLLVSVKYLIDEVVANILIVFRKPQICGS
jgi:hypothetical protein